MTLKVFLKDRKHEIITITDRDFCLVHKYLNERFGLVGWEGYEIK
ncbi:MAG: hypothetical protein ACI9N9_000045 [Enterobacterales bacterium]|jgi:hypothetical protein